MCYKLLLMSTLIGLLISPICTAEYICTKDAIEQANNQYLQKISSQISQFTNQHNNAAVTALNNIKPAPAFKKKHAQEIKHFNDPNYQPSAEFCTDVYINLETLGQQLLEITSKYQIDESH